MKKLSKRQPGETRGAKAKDPEQTKVARGLRLYNRHNDLWEAAAAAAGMEKTEWLEKVLENYEKGISAFPLPVEAPVKQVGSIEYCPVCGIRKRHPTRKNGVCNRCV